MTYRASLGRRKSDSARKCLRQSNNIRSHKGTSFESFWAEQMQDPEFARLYEEARANMELFFIFDPTRKFDGDW